MPGFALLLLWMVAGVTCVRGDENQIDAQLENLLRELLEPANDNENARVEEKSTCDTQGSFASLEHALMGYNALFGSPLAASRDPGFTLPIFTADYSDPTYTSDCRYRVPRGIVYSQGLSCDVTFSSAVIRTQQQWLNLLSENVNIEGDLVKFLASTDYKLAILKLSGSSILVTSQAICHDFHLQLNPFVTPPLSESFLTALRDLETTDSSEEAEKYFEFLNIYGTHFVESIYFGARYTRLHELSQSGFIAFHANDSLVTSIASQEALYKLGGEMFLSQAQIDAIAHLRETVRTSSTSSVGPLPVPGDVRMQWAAVVGAAPMPVKYTLAPIENLFTSRYFAEIQINYDLIRSKLVQYKAEYCQRLLFLDQVSSCEQIVDFDDCANNPCENGGTCLDGEDSYTCLCTPAFKGQNCSEYFVSFHNFCGNKELTFAQSQRICPALGLEMATWEEVRTSWNAGYSMRGCGWVSDGISVMPYYGTNSNCGGRSAFFLCTMNQSVGQNVYCSPLLSTGTA